MPSPTITLVANTFNIVTSNVEKTWESLGFSSANIGVIYLIDPENNNPIVTWDPNFPEFSSLTGVSINKKYMIQPTNNIVSSDFQAPLLGDTPSGPTTLVANALNARTCDTSKTWAQLGWTNSNIGIVYLVDPNALIPIKAWDPNNPFFSDLTGIEVGKSYLIQPTATLVVSEGFYSYSGTVTLPITSVLLTSFDEFGYDTEPIVAQTEYGGGKTLNGVYDEIKLGKNMTDTDFMHMLREDADKIPGLVNGAGEAIIWVNWFTEGSAASQDNGMNNPTTVRPMLQQSTFQSIYDPLTPAVIKWSVAGYDPTEVTKIPLALKGSGTMNDQSLINGAVAMQTGNWHPEYPLQTKPGINVGIAPIVITMRPITGSGVNDGNYQNWRGYITFNNQPDYDAFALEYEAFVKHYIDLCYNNSPRINLSTIYVGSEFEALLTADYRASDLRISQLFPGEGNPNFHGTTTQGFRDSIKAQFIELLGDLGLYAKTKFPLATITYAANWTDYNQTDALWIHPGIDAVGIDWYMPVSEIHTNDESVMEENFFNGELGIVDNTPGSLQPFKYDGTEYNAGFVAGKGKLSYMKDLMNAPGSTVLADGGIGKTGLTKIPIVGSSHLDGLKRVREYRTYLQTTYPLTFNNKPFIATELGISSMKGASVEPNVFPFILGTPDSLNPTVGAIGPLLPEGHNMKNLLNTLLGFNLYVGDIIGSYGTSFEMDQDHQYIYLKKAIEIMNANGINKQVIYTLDARPSGMFGAVSFNTEAIPARDEVYTYDTPVFPLNLAINGKKAGGWDQTKTALSSPNDIQNLMDRIIPTSGNAINIPESTASLGLRSFVTPDVYDYEWKANTVLPNDYTIAADNGVVINPGKTATGSAGRFAYFKAMGSISPLQRVAGRLNFEAKSDGTGDGIIEVVIFGQSITEGTKYEMYPQARKLFTLTSEFELYGWNIPLLYPEQEYMIGVFVKGFGNTDLANVLKSRASLLGVTATFKKNFCLILDQAGMDVEKPFYRVRADYDTLIGNGETEWLGWSDTAAEKARVLPGATQASVNALSYRKKYLQSSAWSRLRVTTDATKLAVEYVRDTYNSAVKNLYPAIYLEYNKIVATTVGGATAGGTGNNNPGAVNRFIRVEPGKSYTISGFFGGLGSGTAPKYVLMSNGGLSDPFAGTRNVVGGIRTLTNFGTVDRPIYSFTVPTVLEAGTAITSMAIQVVYLAGIDPYDPEDPANDSFTVIDKMMIEEGAILPSTDANWRTLTGDPTATLPNGPTTGGGYLIPGDIDPYDSTNTPFSGFRGYIGNSPLKTSGFSVFLDDEFYAYYNVEDDATQGFAKQVQIKEITLPDLEVGQTTRKVDVIMPGGGTYLTEEPDPRIRRAGLFLRALYLKDDNPTETIVSIDNIIP